MHFSYVPWRPRSRMTSRTTSASPPTMRSGVWPASIALRAHSVSSRVTWLEPMPSFLHFSPDTSSSAAHPPTATRAERSRGPSQLHQHFHHGASLECLFHAFVDPLEWDSTAHQRAEVDGAGGRQANGFFPVLTRVEPAAVHVELAREHLIEIHRHRLGVNGH